MGRKGRGCGLPGQLFTQGGGQTAPQIQAATQLAWQIGQQNAQASAGRRALAHKQHEQHKQAYTQRREEMLAARERRRQALRAESPF